MKTQWQELVSEAYQGKGVKEIPYVLFERLENTNRWVKLRDIYYLSKHYKFYKDMQANKSCKSF